MKKFAKQFLALLLAMTMALGPAQLYCLGNNVVDEPTGTQTAPADEQETAPADEAEEQTEAEEPTEDEPAARGRIHNPTSDRRTGTGHRCNRDG